MTWRSPWGRALTAYVLDFKLTRAGKYLVAGGVIAGVFAMPSIFVPVYTVLGTLFAVGFLAALVNLGYRPRLRLSGTFPDRAVAGEPVEAKLLVTNVGHLPAYDVGVGFLRLPKQLKELGAGHHVAHLPGGETVSVPVRIRALRRGSYPLPALRVFSTFPFNLLRSGSGRMRPGPLLVLPAFSPAADIGVPVSPRHQPGGIALTSHLGESPEYVGNRDFHPGDPIRRIDAHAWARLARPIVREYQEEYFCRLALVLDTYVPPWRRSTPEGFPGLEAGISLAATVTDALSRGEYLIDIFAAGPKLFTFRTGRHTSHFDSLLEVLACLEPCRTNPFDTLVPALAEELRNISSVICIFLDWDSSRRDLVRMASESGCRVKCLLVRDGNTTEAVDPGEADEVGFYTPAAIRAGGFEIL